MEMSLGLKLSQAYASVERSLNRNNVDPWILDNFYVIQRHYKGLKKNRIALKQNGLFDILFEYCENTDFKPNANGLIRIIGNQPKKFSYFALASIKSLLSACAIIKIGEIVQTRKSAFLLPNLIKLLLSAESVEFDDLAEKLWAAEGSIASFEKDYHLFDAETKNQYRRKIAEYALKHKISEEKAAKRLITEAKRQDLPLGRLLFKPKIEYSFWWFAVWTAVFIFLCVAGFLFAGWISLLLAVPFGFASVAVADFFVSLKVPAFKAPRLELKQIPQNAKTLVAVAALLNGGKNDEKIFNSLLRFYYMNPDENVYFCILADLPDSKTQTMPEDEEIIKKAKENIDKLNSLHGNRFSLFIRKRVMNKSENRFGGWERKRGAVCDLVSFITKGEKGEYYGSGDIKDIKYLLTLDSDTNLSVGVVRELISVALHPANRPIVKNGRVVSGYGIIQPTVQTELESAYKTGFSRLISGSGGADAYATAAFHRSQCLFGSGNFCGKGLLDVSLFSSLVINKIPTGLVLSHDFIEGSIMNTLIASDITFTDSTPGNTVSFFRRQHRWMRGDFQNLYFLQGNLIPFFNKLRLLGTVLRHSSPAFTLISLVFGCFLKETSGLMLFLLSFSELLIPSLLTALRFLCGKKPFAAIRFFSKAYSVLTQTAIRLIFEISATARKAVLTIHACFLAATRLITRKHTLQWTTAAQTEKLSSSLGKYVLDSALSAFIGLLMLIFALPPFIRLCGLLFFVYPLVSLVISRPLSNGNVHDTFLTEKQKQTLTVHAKDMFRFYSENVDADTNHLPPDNIQFSPVSSKAMRTSPTNIGFYLVSLLAARDLEIINSRLLAEKLEDSLGTIERLEKFRGNLFNWYDLNSLSVIGEKFVSTVDSGNFLVMLVTLKEGLKEYSDKEPKLLPIISKIEALIAQTDITVLFDQRKKLFKIGVKPDCDNNDMGCYDLLMSEARMTGYYAVASSLVDKRHWSALGRTLTHRKGYLGMLSWSGTSFEYLMPQLFLPLYRDSFMFESVAFSVMVQRSFGPLWGISESGFYSFDSEMNYQYKANGLQPLALRRIGNDEKILSPYSTYLSLCVCGNDAMKNLSSFESKGMYGKYGLYEALDLNGGSGGLCVKSYMAHHVGMSLIAVMNAVFDNLFVKRFMSDNRMAAAKELLQEKIPIDALVFEDSSPNMRERKKYPARSVSHNEKTDVSNPKTALISRGDMNAVISSNGHVALNCGERMLTNTYFDKSSLRFSLGTVFTRGSNAFGCVPLCGEGNFNFERGNGNVSHIVSSAEFSGRVRYSMAKNSNCFVVNTRAEALKKYDITLVFEPVLETKKNFLAHISFSRLFIESEYDKAKRILYFHRRSRKDGSHIFTLAVAPKDKDMSFTFLTSKEGMKASSVTSPMDYAFCSTDNAVGASIDPICLVRAENAEGGKATFLISCGETKRECEKNIHLARMSQGDYPSKNQSEMLDKILVSLLYGRGVNRLDAFTKCGINDLWSKSISGDHPLVLITLSTEAINRTDTLLGCFATLSRACLRCEMIFLIDDKDKYNRPVEGSVRERCVGLGLGEFIGRRGGIFLLRKGDISSDLAKALKNTAAFFLDMDSGTFLSPEENSGDMGRIITTPQRTAPLLLPEGAIRSNRGYFINQGFVVDKSDLPEVPFSFVLTGYRFSTVVTQSSLGYSFFDNARERRLCSFFGDPRSIDGGERLIAKHNGKNYDLCAVSNKVIYEKGKAVYCGNIENVEFSVTVTIPPKYPVKLIKVRSSEPIFVSFVIQPVMGDSVAPVNGIEAIYFNSGENKCLMFRNPFGMTYPEGRGFGGVCGGAVSESGCSFSEKGTDILFFLGSAATERGAREIAARVNKGFFETSLKAAEDFAQTMIPPVDITTKSNNINALLNFFLPYQVAACRFYARGSFYQSGGAYGFRDQLQDCLALIYSNPKAVRTHILRCCAHQYAEGDVMHWWHTRNFNKVNRGIKSKCSDDLLYLPLVTADYMEKTSDTSLSEINIPYLISPPLGSDNERYEQPNRSDIKASVYHHCLKALEKAFNLGEHGLILMGSCDWNDAFSLVGAEGKGESVFTSLLYVIAAEKFAPICQRAGDAENAEKLRTNANKLREAVENNAFFGDRYARAICDDGSVLGIEESEECKIDILSQAFAALAGLNGERTKKALETAFSRLYDGKNKIFRLFSPSFENGSTKVGYIRGYVSGIRENGGQYTHGALWGALGCFKTGMKEEGLLILECADPSSRSANKLLASKYKNEPYAVSADIYSGLPSGRGGWSWYTGAAAWFYRIMLQTVLGLNLSNKAILSAKPLIPFKAEITSEKGKIKVVADENIKEPRLNGETVTFPLEFPQGENELFLPLE